MTSSRMLLDRIVKILCCTISLALISMCYAEDPSPINSNEDISNEFRLPVVMDSFFSRAEYGDTVKINIHYPQLVGPRVAQAVNELLYTAAVTEDDVTWLNSRFQHELTYDVYFNESVISCLFDGYYDTGGTYAAIKKGVVADWQTGKALAIDTFVSLNELQRRIAAEKLEYTILLDPKFQTPEIKKEIHEALTAYFSQENPHVDDYYIKENVVGVIVYVPHFDMVCVEMKLEAVR